MQTEHQIIRQRLLERKGLTEPAEPKWTLENLEQEWSQEFEEHMRNRLMMGALRYGGLNNPNNKGGEYGFNIGEIVKRTGLYMRTGNAEYLADIANFALAEFVQRPHPKFHFKSIDRND